MPDQKERHYSDKKEKEKSYEDKDKPAYDWKAKCHARTFDKVSK